MESLAGAACVMLPIADFDLFVGFGYGRQAQDLPVRGIFEEKACEVMEMDPLHHQNDDTAGLVIQPGEQGVREPLIERIPQDV